jgi:hypothetical protein
MPESVRDHLHVMLTKHGLWPDEAKAVLDLAEKNKALADIKNEA